MHLDAREASRRRYARADTEYEYELTTVEQFHGPRAYADEKSRSIVACPQLRVFDERSAPIAKTFHIEAKLQEL
jgi:hypothetical protein